MTQPLLSICIPTYNREKYLRTLLESIDRQHADESLYEVHVQDNASTDGSEAIFRSVARGRPNWRWRANETNRGAYLNIRLCTLEATGQYTWIVGSDDYLVPDAMATLFDILSKARQHNMAALFICDRFPREYAVAKAFTPSFRWLRHVSVNVPAFITAVVWEANFWKNYPYEKYPTGNFSLPHLDAFVSACTAETIYGYNRHLFVIGQAESTATSAYSYHRRYPYDNVFEYPTLYQKILRSRQIDFYTRMLIWLRRFSNVREMYKKLVIMRYQEQYYHVRAKNLKAANGTMYTWPLIYLMAKMLLEWKIGGRIANRKWQGTEKLPTRDKETLDNNF